MTRIPEPPGHREKVYGAPTPPARPVNTQPDPEVTVTNRHAVKVLYGPKGEVIARHDPNTPVGFTRPT